MRHSLAADLAVKDVFLDAIERKKAEVLAEKSMKKVRENSLSPSLSSCIYNPKLHEHEVHT